MLSRLTATPPALSIVACLLALGCAGCRKDPPQRPAHIKRDSAHIKRDSAHIKRESLPMVSAEQVGFDSAKLDEFAKAVGGHGVVIRRDAIAFKWGAPDKPLDIASASKAVYSALVLKAVEQGRIPSLDQPVVEWMPELGGLNAALGNKDARITWRHLINQTSCYGVTEAPGTAFDYNDYQSGLLWILIFEKMHHTKGEDGIDVLKRELLDPIDAINRPNFRIMQSNGRLCRLVISPLDLARFGLVFLHDGKWKDQQIVSAEHVRLVRGRPLPLTLPRTAGEDAEMLPDAPAYGGGKNQDDHLGCYSHMWWLNRRDATGALLFPSAPEDAFAAIGYGGLKVLMVVPSLDMVISWNTELFTRSPMLSIGRQQMDGVLKLLFAAVKSPPHSQTAP